jgi:hypothetical protein
MRNILFYSKKIRWNKYTIDYWPISTIVIGYFMLLLLLLVVAIVSLIINRMQKEY